MNSSQISTFRTVGSIFLIALFAGTLAAQSAQIKPRDWTVSLAVGPLPTFVSDGGSINMLPVSAAIGYRFSEFFSAYGYAGYTSMTSKPIVEFSDEVVQYTNNMAVAGLRGEVHAQPADRIEMYGGGMVSLQMPDVTREELPELIPSDVYKTTFGPDTDRLDQLPKAKNEIIYSGFVGMRYFPTRRLALFGEVGYGISLLSTGITLRI